METVNEQITPNFISYLDRIATTGSSRAALKAGRMPARIPIITQSEIARNKMPPEIKTGKLKMLLSTSVSK